MPSLSDYTAIREAIRSAFVATWDVKDPENIEFGLPPLAKATEDLPYVCCELQPVSMAFTSEVGSVRGLGQDVVFKVFVAFRKPKPEVQDSESHKVEKFNLIAATLESSTLFANVGMMPHISQFDPTEWMQPQEGAHGFSFDFSMLVRKDWGT